MNRSRAEISHIFHKLWTKAVGTEDYVKAEWKELNQVLDELCDTALPKEQPKRSSF